MNDYDCLDIADDNEKTSCVNEYKVIWVDTDYDIREIFIEAENKKKAIIKFFTEEVEVDAFGVENFKIKKV